MCKPGEDPLWWENVAAALSNCVWPLIAATLFVLLWMTIRRDSRNIRPRHGGNVGNLDDVVPNTSIEGGDGDFELKVQRSDGDDDHAAPTDDAPLLSLKWLWISIFAADVALQLVQWLGKTYVTSPRPSTRFRCSGWETGELQPEGEPRNGWPSGHVMNSVFVASVLTLLLQSEHFRRKNESCAWIAVTATWLLVAAICWARWALGCHTIVQIVGGACIGGMGGLLVMRASETRR